MNADTAPEHGRNAGSASEDGRRRFAAFLLASVFPRIGQVAVLLLLVALGGPRDVGVFGLFTSYFLLLVPLSTQNVHAAIGRLYFDERDDDARRRLAATLLSSGIVAGLCGSALALPVLAMVPDTKAALQGLTVWMLLGAAIVVCSQFFNVLLRVEDRVRQYVVFNVVLGAGYPVMYLLVEATGTVDAAACRAYILTHVAASLCGLGYAGRSVLASRPWFVRSRLRAAVGYGSGTVAYMLSQWFVNYSGRWIGASHLDDGELAVYTLVSQLCAMLTMMITSAFEAQRVRVLKAFSQGDARHATGLLWSPTRAAAIGICVVYAPIIAFAPLAPLVLGSDYTLTRTSVVFAFGINLVSVPAVRAYWISTGMLRTKLYAILAIVSAAVTVALGTVLVATAGVGGLLLASLVGTATLAILSTLVFGWLLRTVGGSP